jgi:hypothetical protein
MALTEDEKLKVSLILEIGHGSAYANPDEIVYDELQKVLTNLSTAQETMVRSILTQWDTLKFGTSRINADGYNNTDQRQKVELKKHLQNTIGFRTSNSGVIRLGRA